MVVNLLTTNLVHGCIPHIPVVLTMFQLVTVLAQPGCNHVWQQVSNRHGWSRHALQLPMVVTEMAAGMFKYHYTAVVTNKFNSNSTDNLYSTTIMNTIHGSRVLVLSPDRVIVRRPGGRDESENGMLKACSVSSMFFKLAVSSFT